MAAEKGGYGREIKGAALTTAVGGVLTAIAAYIAPGGISEVLTWPGKAWHWLATGASAVGDHFARSTPTPNWLLYVLGLAAVLAVVLVVAVPVKLISARLWRAYDTDTFDGVRWRWGYVADKISNLRAYCAKCDGTLVAEEQQSFVENYAARLTLHCEHCAQVRLSQLGTLRELEGVVGRRIERILRTDEWRQKI